MLDLLDRESVAGGVGGAGMIQTDIAVWGIYDLVFNTSYTDGLFTSVVVSNPYEEGSVYGIY